MKRHTVSARMLALGASAAVALGTALVAAPAANAAPASNAFTCSSPIAGNHAVTVVTDVPGLPATAAAGFEAPAGMLEATNKVTIAADTYKLFVGFGVSKVDMVGYDLTLGESSVPSGPLSVAPSAFAPNPDGTYSATINAKNLAFSTPKAGTYTVAPPKTYKLVATLGTGGAAELTCTNAVAPTVIGSVTILKNDAFVSAKAKKAMVGKTAKVVVKVKADNEVPTGQVTAKVGKKTFKGTLKNGKAVIKVSPKFLKRGNNVARVKYAGDDFTSPAKAKATIKVA